MQESLNFDDVSAWLEKAAKEGLLAQTDFLPLLVSLLRSLPLPLADQALSELPYLINDDQRRQLERIAASANRLDDRAITAEISEDTFHAQKAPRFGARNPELFDYAFWTFMVRRRWSATSARYQFDQAFQQHMAAFRERLERGEDPLKMTLPHYSYGTAVWSFDRFGMSRTRLPDGRILFIAGEHEDFYDPDFYIYNDVIALDPELHITIYGYPSEIFPATDFHSATLVGDSHIYIIGCVGYTHDRQPGKTPVYRLDCKEMRMEALTPGGDPPGWISRHTATYVHDQNAILVDGGKIFTGLPGDQSFQPNPHRIWLDLNTLTWSRETPEAA